VDRTFEVGKDDPAELRIVAPPSGELEAEVLVPAGAVHDGMKLSLSPKFEQGAPREQAWIRDQRDASPVVPGTRSVEGPLAPGNYVVGVWVRTGATSNGFGREEVEIVAGKRASVRLDLRETFPGRLRISVRLGARKADDGWVEVVRLSGECTGSSGISLDPDGRTLLGGVAPGRLRVQVSGPERRWAWTDPREVALEPGEELPLEIVVPFAERTVVVHDATGAVLADRDVLYVAGDAPPAVETRVHSDADGRLHLDLPVGPVRFRLPEAQGAAVEWKTDLPEPFVLRLAPR
jgi:hypothetical protein